MTDVETGRFHGSSDQVRKRYVHIIFFGSRK